jgi:hypothetical protein
MAKKIAVLCTKNCLFMKNLDHKIGFEEKRQFFGRKVSKIAQNCDHHIDPRGHHGL